MDQVLDRDVEVLYFNKLVDIYTTNSLRDFWWQEVQLRPQGEEQVQGWGRGYIQEEGQLIPQ